MFLGFQRTLLVQHRFKESDRKIRGVTPLTCEEIRKMMNSRNRFTLWTAILSFVFSMALMPVLAAAQTSTTSTTDNSTTTTKKKSKKSKKDAAAADDKAAATDKTAASSDTSATTAKKSRK